MDYISLTLPNLHQNDQEGQEYPPIFLQGDSSLDISMLIRISIYVTYLES